MSKFCVRSMRRPRPRNSRIRVNSPATRSLPQLEQTRAPSSFVSWHWLQTFMGSFEPSGIADCGAAQSLTQAVTECADLCAMLTLVPVVYVHDDVIKRILRPVPGKRTWLAQLLAR